MESIRVFFFVAQVGTREGNASNIPTFRSSPVAAAKAHDPERVQFGSTVWGGLSWGGVDPTPLGWLG